jgi:hypothetical protein
MPLLEDDRLARLVDARREVAEHVSGAYDEVLDEVSGRIRETGSIGKVDVGALLFWKRLQANTPWAAQLQAMPEARVREITAIAVQAVRNRALTVP